MKDDASQTARRNHFLHRLSAEAEAAGEGGVPISLAMISLDGYHTFLRKLGQATMDRIIFDVARLIEGDLRSRDFVGRFSDDTFGVILPETTAAIANAHGVRLRLTIGSSQFGDLDHPVTLTVSVGISNRRAGVEIFPSDMVDEAQEKRSRASRDGGNCMFGASLGPLGQNRISLPGPI